MTDPLPIGDIRTPSLPVPFPLAVLIKAIVLNRPVIRTQLLAKSIAIKSGGVLI